MTTTDDPGLTRSPGISYQQLLDGDSREVPAVLRLNNPQYLGSEDLDVTRYTSRDWHEEEVDHVWRKVWQYACRTDEIPEVGDYYVYEIVRDSYIVMRTESGIKALQTRLLKRLEDHHFAVRDGRPLHLGLSGGHASFPEEGGDLETLLAVADRRMYADKARRKKPELRMLEGGRGRPLTEDELAVRAAT